MAKKLEDRWVLVSYWILAALLGVCAIVDTGSSYLDFPESGPFLFGKISAKSLLSSFGWSSLFLLPAAVVVLLFVCSTRKSVRYACTILAILSPVLLGTIWVGNPIVMHLMIPWAVLWLSGLVGAMVTGAAHSGEWWQDRLMVCVSGVVALWSAFWLIVPLMCYAPVFRSRRQGIQKDRHA